MTSIPIVASCVALGNSRYTGLAIREKREAHGTCNQIEGLGNRNEKVIVIDDCVASGSSLYKAISILEQEGYQVEGCICVINISSRGGANWIRSLGYKMEYLFDIWPDLMDSIASRLPSPGTRPPQLDENIHISNGLTPADAVRLMIGHYLKNGLLPQPPDTFDKEYDGQGGIFVSLRCRNNNFRIARSGFLQIGATPSNLGRDIGKATFQVISRYTETIKRFGLENLKVGVSLIGKQEPESPGDLDFLRYGVTVVSKIRPNRIGGALPNTQAFVTEMEQYTHAIGNAGLKPDEPHVLYRFSVEKSIESGFDWPAFGTAPQQGSEHERIGQVVTAFVKIRP